jgi:hypothetical protein
MLNNLDATLDEIGAWGECYVHYRYMAAYTIGLVGRVAKSTPTAFWTNHLSAFKSNGIPTEIDMQEIHYSTKKLSPWVKASYSEIARGQIPATLTDTTIANTSAQGQENNSIESGTGDGSNPLATQTDSPGAITGLSNLKRKMARRKRELTKQWIHMKTLHMIWQCHGPTCANMKTTLQIKIMFHKDTVHPARARLGRTDVCLRHNG